MSTPLTLTDTNFPTLIGQHEGVAIVDVWASWCAPCVRLAPTIDALAAQYAGRVRVGKLELDANPGTAGDFDVRSIPTVLVFNDGKLVDRIVGALPAAHYVDRLERELHPRPAA